MRVFLFLGWILAVVGNSFMVYLWIIFGMAAAGGGGQSDQVPAFLWATGVGAGLALITSMYFLLRGKLEVAIASTILAMPFVFATNAVYGAYFTA